MEQFFARKSPPIECCQWIYPVAGSFEMFLACIRQGNYIYDSGQLHGILSVDQAVASQAISQSENNEHYF